MHYEIPRIGIIIRDARKGQKLSQKALAKKVGVSKRTITDIETGKRNSTYDVVCGIVRVLNISTERIFWPEKTPCTPEEEQVIRAMRTCDKHEQAVLVDIAWAYARGVDREKGAKKQTVIKPSDF